MESVKKLLLLCTFVSAIRLYDAAATVTFKIDPVRPVLNDALTFSCEANYNTNKLQKLSVMAGNKELLSYQPDKRPRVQWQSDETKARFDFKKELSKTRTYLQMSVKKPKCQDQNIYKCIYYEKGETPVEEKIRVNFYVDKGRVLMLDHRESECARINITCIGQAGNPPEQMKWLKKRKGDSTYEPIEPSYIVSDRMTFHLNNCSNTRKEHFAYNPSVDEVDLIIKCGFGDQMEHMSFHSPVIVPENFEITYIPKGKLNAGDQIMLKCAGHGIADQTIFTWFKKTKGSADKVEIEHEPGVKTYEMTDECHTAVEETISYILEADDEIIYCEAEENGHTATAELAIKLGVISNPTDGITAKDMDDKDDKDMHEGKDEHEDGDDMTTSEPDSEGDMDESDKADPEPEDESETTTMDQSLSKPVHQGSGQLRSCLVNVFLTSSLVIIAFQFMLGLSS